MRKRGDVARWGAGILLAALMAGPSSGQPFIRSDCTPFVGENPAATQSALTARWYRRFWTGDCGGLGGCLSGKPNWNDIVGRLVARSPAAQKRRVLAKACRLGAMIGQEWTRPRAVRRIDTGDLERFRSTLESSGDVQKGLDAVDAQARAKIGSPPGRPSP